MGFDQTKASDHIEFIGLLKHTGDFYGQPFKLIDWQREVISDVYGTVDDQGLRQYRNVYLEIPKKNGKTELVAGLGIDHLVNDPPGGQIYCCAAEKEQAGLVYMAAKQMIEQDPDLDEDQGGILKVIDSKKVIVNIETGTFLRVLSAEAFSKHGINPSVVIFDELHAQPNRDLWDTMSFGSGSARKEPLLWTITTAGDDPDRHSIGWEIHDMARKIIAGEIVDPSWYAKIYCAPEDADIYDEAIWFEANPSLGVSVSLETLRKEAISARNSESTERLFRWLRLNQWVSLKRVGWLPLSLWDNTQRDWTAAEMAGKYCYMGLDLSSTIDLTAIALLFPPQSGLNEWRCTFRTFVPIEGMNERIRRDKAPYADFVKSGHLTTTDGDAVDYETVQLEIEALARQFKVKWLCADKWNSTMMTQTLAKKGIKTVEIEQTMSGMSPAMKEIERMLRTGELTHDNNPLVRWCFGNVIVATDGNLNIKPMKNKSIEKIDPIVALIDAMAAAIKLEKKVCAYETHGIRMA